MSEVGKYFDSILDYKLRQENAFYQKPVLNLPKSITVPIYDEKSINRSVTWSCLFGSEAEVSDFKITNKYLDISDPEVCKSMLDCFTNPDNTIMDMSEIRAKGAPLLKNYLDGIKEQKGLYDFEIGTDEEGYPYVELAPITPITPAIERIQLKCIWSPKYRDSAYALFEIREDFTPPTEETFTCDFSKVEDEPAYKPGTLIGHVSTKLDDENNYCSGVIQEEYEEQSVEARVAENGIAIDFKDNNNKSVMQALGHWVNFVKETGV